MDHVRDIQEWLKSSGLAAVVVPSTDEFLSEFAPPGSRRLKWATGFRGSTGTAIISQHSAVLFLDDRYLLQGAIDTEEAAIAIEPDTLTSRRDWLKQSLLKGARLGLDPWLHSMQDMAQWRSWATEFGFALELLVKNPVDQLWSDERPPEHRPMIVDYPVRYAGQSYQAKCEDLVQHIQATGLQALLLADPEDVSWLLNVRAADEALKTKVGEWHIVPSCTSRALIHRDGGVTWFVDEQRLSPNVVSRGGAAITIAPPNMLSTALRDVARQRRIGADPRRTPAVLTAIIQEHGEVHADDVASHRRWRKQPEELEGARRAHIVDAAAVIRFVAWLTRAVPERTISEVEAAEALEAFRAEHPDYKGPSCPLMSASGPSGAQPHYVPRRGACRLLNHHPIFWMDSGGQYLGGSTDNTITVALSTPEPKHVLAHTLVLRGYIALAKTRFPRDTIAIRLDTIARQALWAEGMDFAHSTGHGVGNHLNIHEGPLIGRELRPTSTIPIEAGVIVSNEPAYYAPGDFGLRIESHMIVVSSRYSSFLEFDTISRLPIDPSLVDFQRLSRSERHWLADYHRTVLEDVEPLLDSTSARWLQGVVDAFVRAV